MKSDVFRRAGAVGALALAGGGVVAGVALSGWIDTPAASAPASVATTAGAPASAAAVGPAAVSDVSVADNSGPTAPARFVGVASLSIPACFLRTTKSS